MRLPRYKRLTLEELRALPSLEELRLENKILRAFPSSPYQRELKEKLAKMKAERLSVNS